MGVPAEAAAEWIAAQEPTDTDGPDLRTPTEVWPENWPALGLFLRLQTQWLRDAEGRREGLRYEAAQAAMWMMGCKRADRAQLFDHLVEMQHAALEAFNGV